MSSTEGTYPGDDEDWVTRLLPQQLNKTSAAVAGALAVHYSFYVQREGLDNSTDVLARWAGGPYVHLGACRHRHIRLDTCVAL